VVHTVVFERCHEWHGHVRLTDHVGECVWPIPAIECSDHSPMLPAIPVAVAVTGQGWWVK
jgi:hypothetical protein